jgi:hypothetical protein
MVPWAALWKRRIQAYTGCTGIPMRALMYSANRVWNAVVNWSLLRIAQLRAAIPNGPSVAMCIACGLKASIIRTSFRRGSSAKGMSL